MRTGLEIEISSIIRVNLPTMIRIGFGQGAPCQAGFGDWIDPREFERTSVDLAVIATRTSQRRSMAYIEKSVPITM